MRAASGVCLPGLALRIARAVPVLMVKFHYIQVGREALYAFQNLPSDFRMLPDDRELLARQFARLLQYGIGNAYLADVMQQRAGSDRFQFAAPSPRAPPPLRRRVRSPCGCVPPYSGRGRPTRSPETRPIPHKRVAVFHALPESRRPRG